MRRRGHRQSWNERERGDEDVSTRDDASPGPGSAVGHLLPPGEVGEDEDDWADTLVAPPGSLGSSEDSLYVPNADVAVEVEVGETERQ